MVQNNDIKCIVWDLDNTLWKGVLMEDEIIPQNKAIDLIKNSTRCGIVNSICSKNVKYAVNDKLLQLGINDYFVFNSVSFEPKGKRIKQILQAMNLRPQNVLFIDDDISNLKEAEFYNKGIMVSLPYVIDELNIYYLERIKNGYCRNRLDDYKQLEKKSLLMSDFSSNYDFLVYSQISVSVIRDYKKVIDRVLELIHRTNQLNFTKRRVSKEELEKDIDCAEDFGVIKVQDRFGDYGIVGFFCVKDNRLVHFVFSCRIMNMGVEQYVYNLLQRPILNIQGDVASDPFEGETNWINDSENTVIPRNELKGVSVLLKGSCDFKRMQLFLPSSIEYEFQYMINGKTMIYQNGVAAMAMAAQYSINEIRQIAQKTPCYSDLYYQTAMYETYHDIVFLSTISLANLGVYKHREKDFFLAMGVPDEPMYLEGEKYCNGGKYDIGFDVGLNNIEELINNFYYVNDQYVADYLEGHLKRIIRNIKSKHVCLILGNEEKYRRQKSSAGIFFHNANVIIKNVCKQLNASYIDLSDIVLSEKDVINHFNHFSSKIYFELAEKIKEKIEEISNCE